MKIKFLTLFLTFSIINLNVYGKAQFGTNPNSAPFGANSAPNSGGGFYQNSGGWPGQLLDALTNPNQNSTSWVNNVSNLYSTTARPLFITSQIASQPTEEPIELITKIPWLLNKENKFYEFNIPYRKVTEIPEEQFTNRFGVMTVVSLNWSIIGHFNDGKPNGFIIMINMNTKEVRAGTSTFLLKGIQLFPKEMRIRYYDTWKKHIEGDARYKVIEGSSWQFNDVLRNSDDIYLEADLAAESTSMHCQQSASVSFSCNQKDNGEMATDYDFGASGIYKGQLRLLPGNVGPSRHGFGHLNNLDTQSTGFWNDNKMDIFGVNRTTNIEFYAGQYYNGFQHGVGADIPMSKEHGIILVSKRVFGQANGPGVFIYPGNEGLIFLGMFQNGKKKGEGIYIDQNMNVLKGKENLG